jgi:hypothetical protein
VTAEVPLLESEVNGFVTVVQMGGLRVAAIHNHYLFDNPRVIFAHVEGAGDATVVAQTIKTALQQTANMIFTPAAGAGTALNAATIGTTLGGTSAVQVGVITVHVPRNEQFTMYGVNVPTGVGAESMASFQSIAGGNAAVAFEIALLPSEYDNVARILRTNGMVVTAMHNHSMGMLPPLYFLHGSAVGDPSAIARQIRSAIDQTNSQGSPAK